MLTDAGLHIWACDQALRKAKACSSLRAAEGQRSSSSQQKAKEVAALYPPQILASAKHGFQKHRCWRRAAPPAQSTGQTKWCSRARRPCKMTSRGACRLGRALLCLLCPRYPAAPSSSPAQPYASSRRSATPLVQPNPDTTSYSPPPPGAPTSAARAQESALGAATLCPTDTQGPPWLPALCAWLHKLCLTAARLLGGDQGRRGLPAKRG